MTNIKLNIKGTNYSISDRTRELIDNQVSKFKKFIPDQITEAIVDVEVGKTTNHHEHGKIYRAEFNIKYGNFYDRSESVQEDIGSAIELAGDELIRQIKKNQDRKQDLIRRGAAKIKKILRLR